MTHSNASGSLLIVGAGMAGLGMALAAGAPGRRTTVIEQAPEVQEVGAGLQLSPNAVRVLAQWGLGSELAAAACMPVALQARDARAGTKLGRLRLGTHIQQKYGQPYLTIHRADLQQLLLTAVQRKGLVDVQLNHRLRSLEVPSNQRVVVQTQNALQGQMHTFDADALIGCDGVWSLVRKYMLADGSPQFTGQVAYRGLIPMAQLPPALRANEVSIWLGAKMHVVHYPVKQGDWMNVVAVAHESWNSSEQLWAAPASWPALQQALGTQSLHGDLQAILQAAPHWTRWPLNDRPPMTNPAEHALERLALAGDAAHPMRPYMAQGAAMALEDAWQLGQLLEGHTDKAVDWPALLQKWAHLRWRRNAWVQAKTIRKGVLFHADGMLGALRNVALRSLPEPVMDNPRLYKGP